MSAVAADVETTLGSATMAHKSLRLCIKDAIGNPSAEQLARIRAYTLAEIKPEQLYVRTYAVAHNAIDRDSEAFSSAILADFARTLPGKGLHLRHPRGFDGDSGPAKGRWFEAEVVRMSFDEARALLREPGMQWLPDETDAAILMAGAYMVRTAGNADLLLEIDAGVAGDVSIGFAGKSPERARDAAGRELNVFRWNGPGTALEASLVWLGAQPGARAIKHVQPQQQKQEPAMSANANDEINALKAQVEGATATVVKFNALKQALGDANAALLDTPTALVALVSAGKEYRASLIDDIVTRERQMGLVGDAPEQVAAAKALHEGESVERLRALAAHYAKGAPAAPAIIGGDPNANKGAAGALPENHPLSNPLITGKAA